MKRRVLVADDFPEMRVLIRRVLEADGYEVDVAASLTEARAMSPDRYDAVLVDAKLGRELGTELVSELRSQDPAATRRCLVITGGPATALPADVAVLAKPFNPAQLLTAVRALLRPDARTPGDHDRADSPVPDVKPGIPPARESERSTVGRPPTWFLLDVTRRLRLRERASVAGLLHDSSLQEIAAAAIELGLLRRELQPGLQPAVESVTNRLDAAARSLRSLVDEEWLPVPAPELSDAVQQRTSWLLAAPLAVEADQQVPIRPDELLVIVDLAELILQAMVPDGQTARARLSARADESLIHLSLTVWPAADDAAIADATLHKLAAALRASMRFRPGQRRWVTEMRLPRWETQDRTRKTH
jgi:DNA-binding response OmpR family regulator